MRGYKNRRIIISFSIVLGITICILSYIIYSITYKKEEKSNEEKLIVDQEVIKKEVDQGMNEESKGEESESGNWKEENSKEENSEEENSMDENAMAEDLKTEGSRRKYFLNEDSKETVTGLKVVPDVESTYAILTTLNQEDEWGSGKIDGETGTLDKDDNYLSLIQYLPVEASDFLVTTNSNLDRIIVHQYNGDHYYIGSTDVGNADILHIDRVVQYITVSIYQYKNRKIVDCSQNDLIKSVQQGNYISINRINNLDEFMMEKETITGEVHIESLSNYYNYRSGWYKSWGGAYEYIKGSKCMRNFYQVDRNPYILNVNDSRIVVSITEYDEDGKWLKYNDALSNGDIFQKQPNTSHIGLTIASLKWGVDLASLFQSGLKIDLASEQYVKDTDTISYNNAELSNINHWKSGSYLYETGEYILDDSKVCFDSFCQMDEKEYVVNLPNSYLRMSILEMDEEGTVLESNNLHNGQRWQKADKTYQIAISIYDSRNQSTWMDYQDAIQSALIIGLTEYVRYQHNTRMKALSAWEFIKTMKIGWNLGNSFDSKSDVRGQTDNLKQELNWGNPYITKEFIDSVAECGFDTIRIPVTWYYNTYEDHRGQLRINQEWLNRVQDVVDYCIANDLYVILNTHHEQPIIYAGVDEATMRGVLLQAKELWTEIAEHFKTYDEHLIFESYNEVDNLEQSWSYGDLAAEQMNELNQVFVDTVRETGGNNTNRVLVVPTLLDGAAESFCSAFELPKDKVADKIMVEVHLYSQKLNQEIEADFELLEQFSQRIGAPVLIGEFGTTNQSILPELRDKQASNFVARAAQHGIKCIWWDDGSTFKIIDRNEPTSSNVKLIQALLDGAKGVAYQVKSQVTMNSMEHFLYRMPNLNTGRLANESWGTLTLDFDGRGYPVEAGKVLTISIKVRNEASEVRLQRLLFYTTEGLLVEGGKELQAMYYQGIVPENAANVRVSLNSPSTNISREEFEKYLKAGDIEVEIHMFDPFEVEQIQLIK